MQKSDGHRLRALNPAGEPTELGEPSSAVIMMVDDEPTTLDVLEMFLQREGYERFAPVSDSREAVETLRRERPDVLLLDLMMPHVGGLEILDAMRNDESLAQIPVIILTSSTDSNVKLQALELGATDFLGKPVDPSELALRVRNTLAAKAYRDRLTYYDHLTGLPNRSLLIERLKSALGQGEIRSELSVLRVGLDRFRQINDTLGQGLGDALLASVAERLQKSAGDEVSGGKSVGPLAATPCRLGSDEFVLLLPGAGSEAASRAARKVLASLAEPFDLGGQDLFASCSVGIALSPSDGLDADSLLANAGAAMSHAKQGGGNNFQFYSESLNAESHERLQLENQLRRALERGEISLHYQPKIDLSSGRVVGAEALMRWISPELGFVPPDRFIPIAEEAGLITRLGAWGLDEACRQSRAWQEAGFPQIRIAVNVSSHQFRAGDLSETVRRALDENQLDGSALSLELTEGVIMENPKQIAETLKGFKEMGIEISIDDFGTGYSSLSYLSRFPLDELKIDRSFVDGVGGSSSGASDDGDTDDYAIVEAIISMARSLGLKVVAEGVETEEQLAFLRERGCDQYQGYLCSRPLPPAEWQELLERI